MLEITITTKFMNWTKVIFIKIVFNYCIVPHKT
jgi:hypothetical protein